MTLVTRIKPPAYHKKTVGRHHRHNKKYSKTYWPYLPLLLIVGIGLIFNSILPGGHGAVLGYATDMSIQSLLNDTNDQRQANGGLSALSLNQLLNNAAQAKAQDMANRNYWSHNTPDGQTPWTFMVAAGYNYQLAGENLAYGFTTAADTLTGWMNSPGHRANILNTGYKEVGFGFINIPNYQSNGPETLVVAMYGTLQTVAAAPAQAPSQTPVAAAKQSPVNTAAAPAEPTPAKSVPSQTPSDTTPSAPANETAAAGTPPNNSDTVTPLQTATVSPQTSDKTEPAPQAVNRLDLLSAGKVGWSSATITIIGVLALIIFFLRHGIAWHKILVKGEHFVLKHPLLDVVLVASITAMFVLIRQVGTIR